MKTSSEERVAPIYSQASELDADQWDAEFRKQREFPQYSATEQYPPAKMNIWHFFVWRNGETVCLQCGRKVEFGKRKPKFCVPALLQRTGRQ